ncbi:hypothetical protein D3C81_2115350 [compost metagenome]
MIGAEGDADAEQRMMDNGGPGALPVKEHQDSSDVRACRLTRRCISTPVKAIDRINDSTNAPTIAQKSAAMSLA